MIADVDEQFEITYIDPSGFSLFNKCPTAFLFQRLMGLQKPDASKIYFDYGTDMHVALPLCYEEPGRAIEVFRERWQAREYGEDDVKRNTAMATQSLMDFAGKRSKDICPYEVIDMEYDAPTHDEISSIEVPFLVDIGGLLPLAGRMDAAVLWKEDQTIWALDYKTTSETAARFFEGFENAPATLGYTLALTHILQREVKGMILEAIRVSSKNADTKMELLFVRPNQLAAFVEQVKQVSGDMLLYNQTGRWPQKCSGCSSYAMFGLPGRKCPYLEICIAPNWRDEIVYYEKVEPFHPFKVKTGGEE